jgi:Ricin-type beta-trefoil lectin domain
MTSRRVIALIVGALTLLGGSLPAATALAAAKPAARTATIHPKGNVQLPGPVSQTPLAYTPNVYPGTSCGSLCKTSTIHSTVVANGEVVVAGVFGNVCTPAPATYAQCPSTVPADYMFAYNPATGAIDPDFNPTFNEPVYSLAAGPDNTVYVGGAFTTADGTTQKYLTELYVTPGQSSTDGTLVPGFSASTSAAVNQVALSGNALYVGGNFALADGVDTTPIARLNATTGAHDKSFKFTLSDPAVKPLDVKSMSLSPDGDELVIAGSFLQVNGGSNPRLAVINTGGALGATATLDNFAVPLLSNNCSAQHDYINGVDFSPDGSFFAISDTGYESNGQPGICDAMARFNMSSTGSDVTPAWINYTGGDSYRSIVVAGSVVYGGGHERWMNNQCGDNNVCENDAVQVGGIGAIDANTGLALPWWHPMTGRGIGVQSLATYPAGTFAGSDGGLILGTDVNNIGGVSHYELAMFPMTFTATPQAGGPILNGMFSQGRLGGLDETRNGVADMCVDDANNSSTPDSLVDLATCNNSNEQNWTIGSGNTIQVNGLCMDTVLGGTAPGTEVELNTCDGASSQVWTQGSGNTVINQASGLCLDDPHSSTTSGVVLDINTCTGALSQSWPLPVAQAPPPPPATGLVYTGQVQSNDGVPCMSDSKGVQIQGNPVIIQTCIGFPWQNWTMESNGTIQFKGKCLDTLNSGTSQGTGAVLDKCSTATSQVWQVGSNRSLINQASGLCLNDPSDTAGTQLDITSCNGSIGQGWWLPQV